MREASLPEIKRSVKSHFVINNIAITTNENGRKMDRKTDFFILFEMNILSELRTYFK
jgi:hypothetical protein